MMAAILGLINPCCSEGRNSSSAPQLETSAGAKEMAAPLMLPVMPTTSSHPPFTQGELGSRPLRVTVSKVNTTSPLVEKQVKAVAVHVAKSVENV
jgi:hypothetical protein